MKKHFVLFIAIWLVALSFKANATNTSVTPATLATAAKSAASGDTLVLAAGTYTTAIAFPAITLNLKADPAAAIQPVIAFQPRDTTVTGGSLSFVGLSINPGTAYFFNTGGTNNMGAWRFQKCTVTGISSSFINSSVGGTGVIGSIFIDNCTFSNIGSSNTPSLISLKHCLGSLTIQNSTISNFAGGNIYDGLPATGGTTTNVLIQNNTIYKSIFKTGYGVCAIEGSGYASTSTYIVINNILDGTAGATSANMLYIKNFGGTVTEVDNLYT